MTDIGLSVAAIFLGLIVLVVAGLGVAFGGLLLFDLTVLQFSRFNLKTSLAFTVMSLIIFTLLIALFIRW